MKYKAIKYPYCWLAFSLCISLSATAQKLPNVQPAALYAPADVKIDGTATEWGNQLQAYNKSTSLYYTMANNNVNLYLAVRSTDYTTIDKILGGGIAVTITGKNGAIGFTTPLGSASGRSNISKAVRSAEPITDSLLNKLNKDLAANFKEIALTGIAAIADPTISVYNEYGIKVSGQISTDKAYTCEIAVPLKYINPVLADAGSFNYNIMVNGVKMNIVTSTRNGEVVNSQSAEMASIMANIKINGSSMMELANPTDFTGTYTLIKK